MPVVGYHPQDRGFSCFCLMTHRTVASHSALLPGGQYAPGQVFIPVYRLSSYLVWVGVKFSNAKEEELLINDASQIGSKKFDFSIE